MSWELSAIDHALYCALIDETTASTKQTINSNEKKSINLVKSENQELELDNLVLRILNEVLRKQAQEWAQEGKDPVSLTKLNIDNITANVHPRLRKMACILTHPKHYTGK